jgi:hypothetical protein
MNFIKWLKGGYFDIVFLQEINQKNLPPKRKISYDFPYDLSPEKNLKSSFPLPLFGDLPSGRQACLPVRQGWAPHKSLWDYASKLRGIRDRIVRRNFNEGRAR